MAGWRVRPVLAARHELLLRLLPPRVGRARGRRGAPQRRRHGDPFPDDLPAGARAQLAVAAEHSRPRVSHSPLLAKLPAPSIYPLPLHACGHAMPARKQIQVGRRAPAQFQDNCVLLQYNTSSSLVAKEKKTKRDADTNCIYRYARIVYRF
jgi:hypothetical protein